MRPHLGKKRERVYTARRIWPGLLSGCVGLAFLLAAGSVYAQGTVSGRVLDAELGEPLSGAQVELARGSATISTVTTDDAGRFTFTAVAAGTYSVIVSTLGYEIQRIDNLRVGAGTSTVPDVLLVSRVFKLNPIVVTASRQQEKALDAPAAVFTVDAEQIAEAQPTTVAEYVRTEAGVDVWTSGVQSHSVVARGFNNIFSGTLYVLTDNRWASVPSLRINVYALIPLTNDDLERIEIVLGPGSALYGPNVDQGVMHMITSSPLDKQETLFSITGGARGKNNEGDAEGIFQGTLRQAGLIGENVGYKISASYLNGTEWNFTDPVEAASRQNAIDAGADPDTLKIGARNFDAERVTADARVDFRVAGDGRLVLAGGTVGLLSGIEQTGIGAAQADNWFYSYAQARFNKGRFFTQAYINFSDAGDTFTLRDGNPIVDKSKLLAAQIQHGVNLLEGRQDFTYGVDVLSTLPDTEGTVHGDNEDVDNIFEIGGYLQSKTAITPQWDLVLAGRLDYHDVIDQVNFSPRAAIVFKPTPAHSIRATYNRAFSNPTSVNLFLDLTSSPRGDPLQGGNPFGVDAAGVPSGGYTFARDAQGDPFMRTFWSDFIPGVSESDPLPLDATLLWDVAVQLLLLGGGPDLSALPAPTAAQVSTQLRVLNTTTLAFDDVPVSLVQDVPELKSTINNTLEAGYKGVISDRLMLNLSGYYSEIDNFVSPLRVETPNVFLEPASLAAYLGNFLPQVQADAIAAGMTAIPLATVAPQNTQAANPADILLTYRQFEKVEFWGADVGLELLLGNYWSVFGSYSYVSKELFNTGEGIISLNAPQNKASLGGEYRNERLGLSVGLRGRWIESFPLQSGVYVGTIDDYAVADLNIVYKLPFHRNAWVTLTSSNVLNNKHTEVIGAPELSGMYLLRFRYTLP